MYGIQVVGIFISLLMVYVTFVYIKQQKIDKTKGWFWLLVWIGAIIWLSFVDYTKQILLGITNVATIFELTIGLGVLFAVVISFFNYLKNVKIERNQEKLIRIMTIKKAMEEDKNGKTNIVCENKPRSNS